MSAEAVELDKIYAERNAVVVAFARLAERSGWTVGLLHDAEEPDWPVLVIDTPGGQVSWHLKSDEARGFGQYPGEWDGHTTEEKYARLAGV